jgi:hypothetical protein
MNSSGCILAIEESEDIVCPLSNFVRIWNSDENSVILGLEIQMRGRHSGNVKDPFEMD